MNIGRGMAWERAQGELKSILWTYDSEVREDEDRFEGFNKALKDFIDKVDSEGWAE